MISKPENTASVDVSRAIEFRRLEVKYLVNRAQRTGLARDIAALMRRDSHTCADGTYVVRSLYFDTPDYMAYHDKLAATAVRHKLRVRAYGDPSQAPSVRMEVKSRYVNFIHKLAVDVPREEYGEMERAFRGRTLPPVHLLNVGNGAREFFRLQRLYNMEPNIIVQYRRQAFERRELSRTRVNFDDELQATRNLDLLAPLRGGRPLLGCGNAIFEIKVDGVMPFWLHTLIAKYDLQNQAISKYCYAVRSEARFSAIERENDLAYASWD